MELRSQFLNVFNRKSLWLDKTPIECASTDACDEGGGGQGEEGEQGALEMTCFIIIGQWICLKQDILNEKEILAVVIAAHRLAHIFGVISGL